mmetsp:Transcript_22194/g.48010  ORF Transcript_22194/g.48010 Transcript_22194/m.48010 type:complete len:229 (+) Transcript_22194:528-1214(+)
MMLLPTTWDVMVASMRVRRRCLAATRLLLPVPIRLRSLFLPTRMATKRRCTGKRMTSLGRICYLVARPGRIPPPVPRARLIGSGGTSDMQKHRRVRTRTTAATRTRATMVTIHLMKKLVSRIENSRLLMTMKDWRRTEETWPSPTWPFVLQLIRLPRSFQPLWVPKPPQLQLQLQLRARLIRHLRQVRPMHRPLCPLHRLREMLTASSPIFWQIRDRPLGAERLRLRV